MSTIQIAEQDTYVGTYPTVFKKINANDVNVDTVQLYKTWIVTSGSYTSSMLPLRGIYTDINNLPALNTNLTFNDAINIDGSLQSVIYFSINHLYYKYKTEPYKTYGPTNLERTSKVLYESASIFSFPQTKIGEGIKPGSLKLQGQFISPAIYGVGEYGSTLYGNTTSGSVSLSSDRYGNLIHDAYPTESIISGIKYYEGFNEYFDRSRILYESANVSYIPGILMNYGTGSYGYQAEFSGNGYIKTAIDGYYDRNHDFAISFFIQAENTGSTPQIIITKSETPTTPQFPFKIELDTSSCINFTVAGSTEFRTRITSSISVDTMQHHIVCQTSGSSMQLWIDGILHSSASSELLIDSISPLSASARIDNTHSVFIGGFKNSNGLTGKLDEIRIYNKTLTSTQIGYLSDVDDDFTFKQTNCVGNVFSKQGLVVLSTPDYRFNIIPDNDYTISYRSTKTMYELNVIAAVNSGDFNMSSNLTLTTDDDQTYKSFVSSSAFSPYITTIGLYNSYGQLLAIGKLAQPIRKLTDVDINFLIKIDLDRNIS
jgi:hypothetical protein